MKKNLNEQYRSKKKEQFSLVCDTEKMQELLNDKKERVIQKERELAQMEAEIELLKQTSSTEYRSQSEELRRLEQEVTQLNTNLTQQKAERDKLVENFTAMQNMFVSVKAEAQQEISRIREEKDEMRAKVKEHADSVKKQLLEILHHAELADEEATKQLTLAKEDSQRRRKRFGLH
ncbi:hypothetical protein RRG08_020762 [Elysia crispata]|uniref:Uncharacterized protein n=1 Tax=Elysia crispata TaxID=231223 RepID=A0AAE1ARR9_9GAST|nr:hypothetical protein RRG08_020762 [Elysia crispata]